MLLRFRGSTFSRRYYLVIDCSLYHSINLVHRNVVLDDQSSTPLKLILSVPVKQLKRMGNGLERSKSVNSVDQFGCTSRNSNELANEIVSLKANLSQESCSRRDMVHLSCQRRIEELEELASSRQKEVH